MTAEDDLRRFLGDPAGSLHDPARLPDAEVFRERIARAREAGEAVLVFGDFDADGVTGLAILTIALRRLGVEAIPYVPSRLDEGHGLSRAAVAAAVTAGARVIITVDTGSSSVAEVAAANAAGLDVLITDHHRVPAVLPPAHAIVNPHRPDASYPDRRLAGSGVAFTLARLLLGESALDLADLAAIGTVADLAPVLGENRAIVQLGLERLRSGPRPGLAALLALARIAPEDVDLERLAFSVAPRLNAAGRVGEAFDAAKLLLAEDEAEAAELAAILETANATRRDLLKTAIAEARTSPDAVDDAAATIVRGPWPVGIVGLVASRLVDERRQARDRRRGARARSSAPRAAAMARSTSPTRWLPATTCCSATAVTPAPPASRSRLNAGLSCGNGSSRSRRPPRRRIEPPASRSTWRSGAATSTTRCTATCFDSRRAGRATRSRSSPSWG